MWVLYIFDVFVSVFVKQNYVYSIKRKTICISNFDKNIINCLSKQEKLFFKLLRSTVTAVTVLRKFWLFCKGVTEPLVFTFDVLKFEFSHEDTHWRKTTSV